MVPFSRFSTNDLTKNVAVAGDIHSRAWMPIINQMCRPFVTNNYWMIIIPITEKQFLLS